MSFSPLDPDKPPFDMEMFEEDAYNELGPWPFVFGVIAVAAVVIGCFIIDTLWPGVSYAVGSAAATLAGSR